MLPFLNVFTLSGGNLWEKILHWYQNSLLRELLEYLDQQVFGLDLGVYDNFTVSGDAGAVVKNVILGFLFGMILATCLSGYTRTVHGRFIRTLIQKECFSPESAATLQDCGVFCSPAVRDQLTRGGALAKLTRCVDYEELEEGKREGFRPDFRTARFYIPEDLKYRAELRYEKKGFGKLQLLIAAAVGTVGAYLLCRVIPALLTFADWLMTVLA